MNTNSIMSTSEEEPKAKIAKIIEEDTTNNNRMKEEDDDDREDEIMNEQELLQQDDDDDDEDEGPTTTNDRFPIGIPETNSIIHHATIPTPNGFTQTQLEESLVSKQDLERLKIKTDDVTVPVAVLLLFPDQIPSFTRARKDTRRRKILVHRGPLLVDEEGKEKFDPERLAIAKVGDRVKPGDTIAIQTRMLHNYSECKNHHSTPPFHLPVIYQDDYFAIVNKPESIVVFSHKNSGYGRHNVKSCLPWVLDPPVDGTISVMRRPNPVHRIDRGTSGLLVCAKTKPAMVELARMFKERKVKKTYTAIVNGNIEEPKETSISSDEAKQMGVCIEENNNNADDIRSKENDETNDNTTTTSWQIIDEELEGQSAVTVWRPLRRWKLENARNDTVSLVELKPKTGRYHQLRRHMAWVSKCPLLGDKSYDGGGLAKTFRDQGFYLCSNKVTLAHPYYNTPHGRKEWIRRKESILEDTMKKQRTNNGSGKDDSVNHRVCITEEEDGSVLVHCEIDLPAKFTAF